MSLSPELLDILRCPESKQGLIYFPVGEREGDRPFLFCPFSHLRYSIDEHGIPVMLVDEAERLDPSASEALVARAQELGLAVPEPAA